MASATRRAAVALALTGVAGIAGWQGAARWRPSPSRYPLQGVDLSLDAPALAWPAARVAGADFAYLVATDGTTGRAPAFEANWAALPEAGLRRGAVHLFEACGDGRAQADAFNAVVPLAIDALPPALEIGADGDCKPDAVMREVERFAAAVEAHVGRPVILRVSRGAERRWGVAERLNRPVWVLGTFVAPGYAPRPWRLWRASAMRRVEGIDRPLDWDVVAP